MPDEPREMTPQDALQRMATVTSQMQGLRVRTEGLTLFIFAMCMMASYLSIVVPLLSGGGLREPFENERSPASTRFFLSAYAPLVWYAIAILGTIGVWRSASLSFQTGMSTPRLVTVFVGWTLIFLVATVLLTFVEGGSPRSWHLVTWAIVVGLFAALNPLRFTKPARIVAALMGLTALGMAAYAFLANLNGRDVGFLTGVALGIPGIAGGLWLMYRG